MCACVCLFCECALIKRQSDNERGKGHVAFLMFALASMMDEWARWMDG